MDSEQADLDGLVAPLLSGAAVGGDIAPVGHDHGEPGVSVSVRTAAYAGHTIRIETQYRIFIDDQLFPDPIHVGDDGNVHYHGLPQYSVASAVDLCKRIVDRLQPGDLPPPLDDGDDGQGGHGHDGGHGGHDHQHEGGHDR